MSSSLLEYIVTIPLVVGVALSFHKKKWIYSCVGLSLSMFITAISDHWNKSGIMASFIILFISLGINKVQQDRIKKYQETTYYKQTKSEYKEVMKNNIGKKGEFLVFDELSSLEDEGSRFLFNVYIPKEDGTTTEIDVIVLNKSGIFVIESKNYSGWIFGDMKNRYWTATLQSGDKNRFYNPIWQNNSHIKYLGQYLGIETDNILSYIVFSDRCEFMKIPDSKSIVHRRELLAHIKEDIGTRGEVISEEEINEYYEKLLPLTQVSEEVKQNHINSITN